VKDLQFSSHLEYFVNK